MFYLGVSTAISLAVAVDEVPNSSMTSSTHCTTTEEQFHTQVTHSVNKRKDYLWIDGTPADHSDIKKTRTATCSTCI